jgi:hypothetical protein
MRVEIECLLCQLEQAAVEEQRRYHLQQQGQTAIKSLAADWEPSKEYQARSLRYQPNRSQRWRGYQACAPLARQAMHHDNATGA